MFRSYDKSTANSCSNKDKNDEKKSKNNPLYNKKNKENSKASIKPNKTYDWYCIKGNNNLSTEECPSQTITSNLSFNDSDHSTSSPCNHSYNGDLTMENFSVDHDLNSTGDYGGLSLENNDIFDISYNPEDPFEFTIVSKKPCGSNPSDLHKTPQFTSTKSFDTSPNNISNNIFNNSSNNSSSSTICDCYCQFQYTFEKDQSEFLRGESSTFEIYKKDCEIRLDITVKDIKGCILYGQVNYKNCKPAENVLVTLLKAQWICGKYSYTKISSTLTASTGSYEFFLPGNCCCGDFKILLGNTIN